MLTNYNTLTTELEHFGATLPKSVADARRILAEARKAAAVQPLDDLGEQYAAGSVTAANVSKMLHATAGALAARDNLHAALTQIENGCHRTMRDGIRDNGEKILKALRPAFDNAATIVQTAGRYFGSDPTAEQIMAGGVAAVAAHEQLADALHTLTRIRNLRVNLADCGYGAPDHAEQDTTWWIARAADSETLDAARRAYIAPGHAFHNLAAAGFTLRMNTPAEAERVAAGARAATEAREEAEREAHLKEHRESWAPSLGYMASAGREK